MSATGSQPIASAPAPKGLSSSDKFARADKEHGHKTDQLTMRERASLGLPYLANEPGLVRDRIRVRRAVHAFNNSMPSDIEPSDLKAGEAARGIGGSQNDAEAPPDVMGSERRKLLGDILHMSPAKLGAVEVEPPFWCDYGYNIKLEGAFYCNFNTTMLDCAEIWIGSGTLFGPNVHLYCGTHTVAVTEREGGFERALPIRIGRDCWVGGNVTIMGGVEIGDGCTIGAGSTVTRDIPAYSVVAGTPARVLKTLAPEERGTDFKRKQEAEAAAAGPAK